MKNKNPIDKAFAEIEPDFNYTPLESLQGNTPELQADILTAAFAQFLNMDEPVSRYHKAYLRAFRTLLIVYEILKDEARLLSTAKRKEIAEMLLCAMVECGEIIEDAEDPELIVLEGGAGAKAAPV